MALSLASISKGRAIKSPRIVLLGVEGVGKSTFASQAENPIFIPMKGEQGIDNLDVAKFPACNAYEDLIAALGVLYQEDHDYKTVVIDSASALEPLVWDKTCKLNNGAESVEKVNGGYGKGYVEALKQWREVTEGLDALRDDKGMASILIGHVLTSEFNDPEADPYTTYSFDVNKKAAASLFRWADCVLFANRKRAIVQKSDLGFNKKASRATGGDIRLLYTDKRPAHPGKNRYSLPYELPLNFAEFDKAMKASAALAEAPAA